MIKKKGLKYVLNVATLLLYGNNAFLSPVFKDIPVFEVFRRGRIFHFINRCICVCVCVRVYILYNVMQCVPVFALYTKKYLGILYVRGSPVFALLQQPERSELALHCTTSFSLYCCRARLY